VKSVAEALSVSRSQLSERLKGTGKPRSTYSRVCDADLLAPLRSLVDERPTYGYRRIGALMNCERLKNDQPRLSHKRIYRLMSRTGCWCNATPANPVACTTARSSRSDRTCAGPRMGLRSHAGTVKWFA
jgi:hypothetical protein